MLDFLMVAMTVGFFAVWLAYMAGCVRLASDEWALKGGRYRQWSCSAGTTASAKSANW